MAQSRQTDQRLQARIRTLFDEARLPVDVDVVDGVVHLVGRVDSPRLHQAAIDLVEGLPGLSGIDDQIDYEVIAPDMATEPLDDDEQFGYADEEALDDDISDTDPTFMEEVSTR
ncbi:MAG TPA: BON domain-containing protein, partial [Nitrolancea sp.]|nr:BON domain-containing protein [Nitrolancea sp.]